MTGIIVQLVFFFLRFSGIPFFIREFIQRRKVTIILYHDIKYELAEKHFKMLIDKYNIISLRDFTRARNSEKICNFPPKSLIITFDDGHKDNYKLLPLFKKYNIKPTIFLCSGIVNTNRHFWFRNEAAHQIGVKYLRKIPNEKRLQLLKENGFEEEKDFVERRALSKSEIDEMKNVVDFQSHLMYHPCLPCCTNSRATEEIVESKLALENDYRLDVYSLSYPNGDYSSRDIDIAQKAGYQCAVTVDIGFNSENTNLFRLKRICIRDEADINELLVKATGFWTSIKRLFERQPYGYVDIDCN